MTCRTRTECQPVSYLAALDLQGWTTWAGPVVTQSGTQIVLRTWQAWASAGFILLPCRTRLACIRHIADQDETVAELASLPIGHIAERDDVGSPWHIGVHKSPDE